MNFTNDVISIVAHNYREVIIVPLVALTQNFVFMVTTGKRFVVTREGIMCEVVEYEERHICELEDDIRKIYGIDAWSFLKKWYGFNTAIDSMTFIKLRLEKYDKGRTV